METIENKQVAEYYDKLWKELESKNLGGINSRHRYILYHLKKAGLKKNSRILEVGCGLGMLTSFIGKSIPNGMITGVDISPESIEFAKRKYGSANVHFEVNDMSNFSTDKKFDIVIFPDVLEHIPVESHNRIFSLVRNLLEPHSRIIIHIPNPAATAYMRIHHPEAMQIIDLELHTDEFLKAMYSNGLFLESLKSYSIFHNEPDYQLLILRQNLPYRTMTQKSRISLLRRSLWLRLLNLIK